MIFMKDLACVIFEGYHQWQSKFNSLVFVAGVVGAAMLINHKTKIRTLISENSNLRARMDAMEKCIQNSKT